MDEKFLSFSAFEKCYVIQSDSGMKRESPGIKSTTCKAAVPNESQSSIAQSLFTRCKFSREQSPQGNCRSSSSLFTWKGFISSFETQSQSFPFI